MESKKSMLLGAGLAVGVGIVSAAPAHAEMTSLINFATLATDITPLMTTAVTTAAGIGALVLAARLCWKFFKGFSKG